MSAGLAALAWALPAALQVLVPQVQPGPDDSGVLAIPPLPDTTQRNLLISAVVIVLIFLARRAIVAFIGRHVESQPLRYRWSKSTAYAGFLVGVLVLLQGLVHRHSVARDLSRATVGRSRHRTQRPGR